jgi:hypothetical protein
VRVRLHFMLLVSTLLAASCNGEPVPAPPPERLLISDPPLPSSVEQNPVGSGREHEIQWEVRSWMEVVDPEVTSQCQEGQVEVLRDWSDRGDLVAMADFVQFVCRFDSPEDALDSFKDIPADRAAGFNYPNFEFDDLWEHVHPSDWSSGDVRAAAAELLCLDGEADRFCRSWMFRGVYGSFVLQLFLHGSDGGFRLHEFEELVESVDRHVTAQLAKFKERQGQRTHRDSTIRGCASGECAKAPIPSPLA